MWAGGWAELDEYRVAMCETATSGEVEQAEQAVREPPYELASSTNTAETMIQIGKKQETESESRKTALAAPKRKKAQWRLD